MCNKHTKEPLKFFCENCEVLFCPFCIVEHSGHSFIEKKFSVESIKKKVEVFKSKVMERIKYLKGLKFRIEEELSSFDKESDGEKGKFENRFSIVLEGGRKKLKEVNEDLAVKFNREKNAVTKIIDKLIKTKKELKVQKVNLTLLEEQLREHSDDPDNNIKSIFENINIKHNNYIGFKDKDNYSFRPGSYKVNLKRDILDLNVGCVTKGKLNSKKGTNICFNWRKP